MAKCGTARVGDMGLNEAIAVREAPGTQQNRGSTHISEIRDRRSARAAMEPVDAAI